MILKLHGASVYKKLKSSNDIRSLSKLKKLEAVLVKYDVHKDDMDEIAEGLLRLDMVTGDNPQGKDKKAVAFLRMLEEFRA